MTTSVHIDSMRLFAKHGVLPQERAVGNTFEVSVRIDFDARRAMLSDSLDATINYSEVVNIIQSEMSKTSLLLENVAYRIQKALTQRFSLITGGHISIYKLQPPISAELQRIGFSLDW